MNIMADMIAGNGRVDFAKKGDYTEAEVPLTHAHAHAHADANTQVHAHTHTHAHRHTQTHTHTQTHAHEHAHVHRNNTPRAKRAVPYSRNRTSSENEMNKKTNSRTKEQ